MGTEDKKESQTLKILTKLRSIAEERVQHNQEKNDQRQQYQEDRSQEEEEKEKKILISLLNTIAFFDKLIAEINARRGQYQKG